MTFDAQIQTLTQDYIVPYVYDQTLEGNLVSTYMFANSQKWAGDQFKFPVKLSNHTQGGSFSDFDEFNTNGENVRQMAAFDPRAYYQSVVIGGIARSVNAITKTQLLSLVKVEMESVVQDMIDDIGTIMYSTGTGNSNKDFLGIAAAYDDGNTVATYGNLSRSTYTQWASTLYSSIGAFDFAKARTLLNRASFGGKKPTVMTCNETVFGYIESDYQASVDGNYNTIMSNMGTITRNGGLPKMERGLTGVAGFDFLYYGGTPIAKDDKAGSGNLYAPNMDYYRWYGIAMVEAENVSFKSLYHKANDYEGNVPTVNGLAWLPFVRPSKQYSWIGQFLMGGNAINHAPRIGSIGSGISS